MGKSMSLEDAAALCKEAGFELVQYSGMVQRKKSVLRCIHCGKEIEALVGEIRGGRRCICQKKSQEQTITLTDLMPEFVKTTELKPLKVVERSSEVENPLMAEFFAHCNSLLAKYAEKKLQQEVARAEVLANIRKQPIPDTIEIVDQIGDEWKVRCTTCGYEWDATETCIIRFGCPNCRLERELEEENYALLMEAKHRLLEQDAAKAA